MDKVERPRTGEEPHVKVIAAVQELDLLREALNARDDEIGRLKRLLAERECPVCKARREADALRKRKVRGE